jgi:hypothetical protein
MVSSLSDSAALRPQSSGRAAPPALAAARPPTAAPPRAPSPGAAGLPPQGAGGPLTRRALLLGLPLGASATLLAPAAPAAAAPGGVLAERRASFLQPEAVTFPRRRLELPFAVLLLRSGYDAADALDFVAMDCFQKDFWLLRRSEWEAFTNQHAPLVVKQGDLTDPLYFDFISTMQLATVSAAAAAGSQVFKEYCDSEEPGCPDGSRLVTRAPELQDNAKLPAAWERACGALIYEGLRGGFQRAPDDPIITFPGVPPPLSRGAALADVLAGVEALLAVFKTNGYALGARLKDATPGPGAGAAGAAFTLQLDGPPTLWAFQSLGARRSSVFPAYDCFAIAAFLCASGLEAAVDVNASGTAVSERWTLKDV